MGVFLQILFLWPYDQMVEVSLNRITHSLTCSFGLSSLGIDEYDGLSMGGFLQVQFLVLFQLMTSNLCHLTDLTHHGAVAVYYYTPPNPPPPPPPPPTLYFEKNIGIL